VPSLSAPRYIKMVHTIASGTSISGTIKGFEVLNNDDIVNFGSDGLLESTTVLTSLNYLNYQNYIKEISIYNSGSSAATAHVFIDTQNTDADELLSISASENGPWVFSKNIDNIISNGNNWDAGRYDNTNTSDIADGKLRIDTGQTVGTYTTPIFKNDSVKFAYIDMLQTTISGAIVAVDSDDYTSTIQIRSNITKPIDYNVYRRICAQTWGFYYKEYLLLTDTEVYDSYSATGSLSWVTDSVNDRYVALNDSQFAIDNNTMKTAIVISAQGQRYFSLRLRNCQYIALFILSEEGIRLSRKEIAWCGAYRTTIVDFYNLRFDNSGGVWLYAHMNSAGTGGYDLSSTGYYLIHYSSTLTVLYNSGAQSLNFITGSWSPVVGGTSLWYCNQGGTAAVIKLSSTGVIEFSYEKVINLKGLCASDDGGCWFIDDDNLYKLDSSGLLVDSIINLDINNELTFVELDLEDNVFFWIVDGIYVKHVSSDGRIYSSTYLEGYTIRRLEATSEGVWVYCIESATGDQYTKYIGRISSGVNKTIENVGDVGAGGDPADIGIKDISYDNPILGNLIPLSDDPVWNDDLEWNKVVTDNAVLPREEYNQLKLTLRKQSIDIDSPTVENIYYQDNVEITNIYPGQSETLYLRISLPDGVTIGGDYESNLRVWWELPVV